MEKYTTLLFFFCQSVPLFPLVSRAWRCAPLAQAAKWQLSSGLSPIRAALPVSLLYFLLSCQRQLGCFFPSLSLRAVFSTAATGQLSALVFCCRKAALSSSSRLSAAKGSLFRSPHCQGCKVLFILFSPEANASPTTLMLQVQFFYSFCAFHLPHSAKLFIIFLFSDPQVLLFFLTPPARKAPACVSTISKVENNVCVSIYMCVYA